MDGSVLENVAEENRPMELPSLELLEGELKKERYRKSFGRAVRSTILSLLVVAAVAVLVAVLMLPVLEIYGSSMTPTLEEESVVMAIKNDKMDTGDVVAFYYNNKILVKRVIARPGDWVDITPDGTVYVNGVALDEPYIDAKAFGECDIELPYQVPEGRYFVMGDHREVSVDSRSTTIGCISREQVVGRIILCVWPLESIGVIR